MVTEFCRKIFAFMQNIQYRYPKNYDPNDPKTKILVFE